MRRSPCGFATIHPMSTPTDATPDSTATADTVIAQTRCWVRDVVIAHALCPFARRPFEAGQIRYAVSVATRPEALLGGLADELHHLHTISPAQTETTLLIHPGVLHDFLDYNDFLDAADALLAEQGYAGAIQIASFHPHYQFAGTRPEDAENYTNRSPYPMLHLIREDSLATALANYPESETIPERNIATLDALGAAHMQNLLDSCMNANANGEPHCKGEPD